ncbi:ERV/ALR sulfhydryl oxidase domain-containing protein [Dipodascopsis tothii]|uniref:ERV/ALR sulfhydryl oxidase domain-containing protein n=1 Tax=Dipodascopsis tothii TaxID=44089 RepID=UPI0034CEA6A3
MSRLAKRPTVIVLAAVAAIVILVISLSSSQSSRASISSISQHSQELAAGKNKYTTVEDIAEAGDYNPLDGPVPPSSQKLSQGGPIMPHLGNETIKAELGRASWKLFHTILARYPEQPTSEEREALSSYIYLFSRVYPCGECAAHFQKLLKKFPPQTSSRNAASQWGCHVHNQVNERLGKELFDCNNIGDWYKCGCEEPVVDEDGDQDQADVADAADAADAKAPRADSATATSAFLETEDKLQGIKIESKEGLTRGG